jgi:ABC-type sugar transport system permease subunit
VSRAAVIPVPWRAISSRARLGAGVTAALFLAPAFTILGLFVLAPVVQSLWMSLHEWSFGAPEHPWRGLGNYSALLHDDRFWNALRVTLLYTVVATGAQLVLGLGLALALQRTNVVTVVLRSAFFFPMIAALATAGIVWRFLLDSQVGLVNGWLGALGFGGQSWLQSTTWSLPALIAVGVWKNVGLTMILLIAGLQGIPAWMHEAAMLDGAGPWQRLVHITLPALRPTLLFAAVMATINSLQLFDLVYAMTGGGPLFKTETLVTYMYRRGFEQFDFGYASALAWVLFVIILGVAAAQLRLMRYRDAD